MVDKGSCDRYLFVICLCFERTGRQRPNVNKQKMVRLAVNSPDTNQSTGLNNSSSGGGGGGGGSGNQSAGMQQQPQSVSGNNVHPPPLLSPIQHQHMHHENGHGLYIPYTGEFYPTEQGYYMPQELCPTHAPLCLHSEFGKHRAADSPFFAILLLL